MSMASARGTPSVSAASASTPDPVPTSSTDRGRTISTVSSSASRHSAVVGCSPVPNDGASINLTAPGRIVVSRDNVEATDSDLARIENPDRIGVASNRGRDQEVVDTERARGVPGRHAVRQRAATVPSPSNSTSSAPSSTSRSMSSAALRRSIRYGIALSGSLVPPSCDRLDIVEQTANFARNRSV